MKLIVVSLAAAELDEAVEYYERRRPGLGEALLEEYGRARTRMLNHPEAWQPIPNGYRCCRLNRFPYGLIYKVMAPETIKLFAFAHLRRESGYWQGR